MPWQLELFGEIKPNAKQTIKSWLAMFSHSFLELLHHIYNKSSVAEVQESRGKAWQDLWLNWFNFTNHLVEVIVVVDRTEGLDIHEQQKLRERERERNCVWVWGPLPYERRAKVGCRVCS